MKAELRLEFVAEIGSNWVVPGMTKDEQLLRAKQLIANAAFVGADVAKFQLIKSDLLVRDKKKATELRNVELPLEWLPILAEHCDKHQIEFMVTPFYLDAVDILLPYVQRFKVASWDITYYPLLEKIGKTGLPVIVSTGASTYEEIDEAIAEHLIQDKDDNDLDRITLLHCTGGYPTDYRDLQLNKIAEMAGEFYPCHVGLSSHCTNPIITASSVLYNAEIIEVHFDLDDKKGIETGHSYTKSSLATLVNTAKMLREAQDCNCTITLPDKVARTIYRRDQSDWLRPVIEK